MVFSSVIFLFAFFPITLAASLLLPRPLQNPLLLVASLIFYAWGEPIYVLLMLASIAVNYVAGLAICRVRWRPARMLLLFTGILIDLLPLCGFKYAHFIVDSINAFGSAWGAPPIGIPPVHLPVGISFFTFQAISYLVDVYRDPAIGQRNPINVALYIAFFPQLIAGPIVRFHDIAAQLSTRTRTTGDVLHGLQRFSVGLAKKVLIANTLAVPADAIFALPAENLAFTTAWLGLACYSLQLYFDFSGYSDMAIGLGRMFGFHFAENFNYPYVSRSIREFWRRWHISLSTWFRDYLYVPLGGNRKRTGLNLLIVFFLCGLWHGANWTFVVWGLYHGCFLLLERYGRIRSLPTPICHAYALFVAMLGWVFFRSDSLGAAAHFFLALAGFSGEWAHPAGYYYNNEVFAGLVAGVLCAVPAGAALWRRAVALPYIGPSVRAAGLAAALALLALCCTVLSAQTYNPFIYFRF